MKWIISTSESDIDKWKIILSSLDPSIQSQEINVEDGIFNIYYSCTFY